MRLAKKLDNRFCSSIILYSLLNTNLGALEFGGMGNVSMGMGSAGVALKTSQWGLYYNPALLAASRKSHFAYSFGVGVQERNFLALARVDVKNLQNVSGSLSSLFSTSSQASTSQSSTAAVLPVVMSATQVQSGDTQVSGYFSSVLKNLVNSSNSSSEVTEESLKTYLKSAVKDAGITNSDIENAVDLSDAVKKFQEIAKDSNNQDKLFNEIKKDLLDASQKSGGNALFDNIISNLDSSSVSNIAKLLGESKDGNVDVDKVLSALGNVKIGGGDANLSRAIEDISLIHQALRSNNFAITSQNGIVLQAPLGANDAFAMGIFSGLFASGSATFDQTHNQIIVQSGSSYVNLDLNGNEISVSSSDANAFNNSSIFSSSAKHRIDVNGLVITEVPVGYGYNFSVGNGELSVGVALKYIFSAGYRLHKSGGFDAFSSLQAPTNPMFSHNFGIDLGLLYSLGGFSLGLVGKNLNDPALYLDENTKFYLNPQLRVGTAYQWGILNFALDMDVLPNTTLSTTLPKSQMIGGGMMFNFKCFDLRMGAMYDMRGYTSSSPILTAGVNILGFLDIAVQSSLRLTEINGFNVPDYLNLKVGGGFSW